MKPEDLNAIIIAFAPVVREFVAEAVGQLRAEIKAEMSTIPRLDASGLAERAAALIPPPIAGEKGDAGKDGQSVTIEDVQPVLREMVDNAVHGLPCPEDGTDGKDGVDGKDGKDGESVTIGDVTPLLKTLVSEAFDALPVPKDGIDGRDGADGKDGASVTVDDARPVINEVVAEAVSDIPAPKDGVDGKDGVSVDVAEVELMVELAAQRHFESIDLPKDGNDGAPGRDALDIELLPCIDTEKSYPRGTYAKHNGGTWRAHQQTSGMHGWECTQNGIHRAYVEQDSPRDFTHVIELSDGTKSRVKFSMPVMIHRGVFRDGETYEPGDTVACGGSTWHCNEVTDEKPGLKDAPWILVAKKGRDSRS